MAHGHNYEGSRSAHFDSNEREGETDALNLLRRFDFSEVMNTKMREMHGNYRGFLYFIQATSFYD